MRSYHQLTRDQRYQMQGLRQSEKTQGEIAKRLGVHKSTVSRELARNTGFRGWRPGQADRRALERRGQQKNPNKFGRSDWNLVDKLLLQDYSPDQVSGRLLWEREISISHETIYLYIYQDKQRGGELWKHLRCQKQKRKRYGSGQERRGTLKNRISIEERPLIVESRKRLGDWEGDTVIGKNHRGALVTLAERKSRYTVAKMLPNREAVPVAKTITDLLKSLPGSVHTITFDNGKEFANHDVIAKKLEALIYFAHPYSSWERGLNENTNGLLRQYFPKGTDFAKVTASAVSKAVDRLNHRPRKVLGYKTPHEIFYNKELSYV